MIIRNGFVRDEDGNWINLQTINRFYVEDLEFYNGGEGYQIHCYSKGVEPDFDILRIGDVYESNLEAQCALDDALGFTG